MTASWYAWSQNHNSIVFSASINFQKGFKEAKIMAEASGKMFQQKVYEHQAPSVLIGMGPSPADPKPTKV